MATLDAVFVRPKAHCVLVKSDPRVDVTPSGVVKTVKEWSTEQKGIGSGVLLKIGKDCNLDGVEAGTRIAFRNFLRYAFADFEKIDGCDVFMIHEDDVLCELDKTAYVE
jgi:co-chaperonin GroES (HSP10)